MKVAVIALIASAAIGPVLVGAQQTSPAPTGDRAEIDQDSIGVADFGLFDTRVVRLSAVKP
jgi:hypothetical protein